MATNTFSISPDVGLGILLLVLAQIHSVFIHHLKYSAELGTKTLDQKFFLNLSD